jgi:hypothetical protein
LICAGKIPGIEGKKRYLCDFLTLFCDIAMLSSIKFVELLVNLSLMFVDYLDRLFQDALGLLQNAQSLVEIRAFLVLPLQSPKRVPQDC